MASPSIGQSLYRTAESPLTGDELNKLFLEALAPTSSAQPASPPELAHCLRGPEKVGGTYLSNNSLMPYPEEESQAFGGNDEAWEAINENIGCGTGAHCQEEMLDIISNILAPNNETEFPTHNPESVDSYFTDPNYSLIHTLQNFEPPRAVCESSEHDNGEVTTIQVPRQSQNNQPPRNTTNVCNIDLGAGLGSCTESFNSKLKLAIHQKNVHQYVKTYQCLKPECSIIFNSEKTLRQHTKRFHTFESQTCIICEKDFGSRSLYKSHLLSVHGTFRPFECKLCHKTRHFMSEDGVRQHYTDRHPNEPFPEDTFTLLRE